jgi:hypothetical protein
MTEKITVTLVVSIISLIAWMIYLGNNSDVDLIRKEILTGQVICKFDQLDENNEPVFKCKTKAEIEEVINFLGVADDRQKR